MNDKLITAALVGAFNPGPFMKIAVDWESILQSPITQYGLAGAGVGGAGSLIRNMFGSPDPETEGSAAYRLLKSLALGGLAGAGVAGGAKAMGYDLPSITSMFKGDKPAASPRWQTSAGVGLLGGLGTLGLAALMRRRGRNMALSGNMPNLLKQMPHIGGRMSAGKNPRLLAAGPFAKGKDSLLKQLQGIGKGTGKYKDTRGPFRQWADTMSGSNRQVKALRNYINERTHGQALGKGTDLPMGDLQKLVNEMQAPTAGLMPGSGKQQFWTGTALTGALHQMMGSE